MARSAPADMGFESPTGRKLNNGGSKMNGANISEILEQAGLSAEDILKALLATRADELTQVIRTEAIRRLGQEIAGKVQNVLDGSELQWNSPFILSPLIQPNVIKVLDKPCLFPKSSYFLRNNKSASRGNF